MRTKTIVAGWAFLTLAGTGVALGAEGAAPVTAPGGSSPDASPPAGPAAPAAPPAGPAGSAAPPVSPRYETVVMGNPHDPGATSECRFSRRDLERQGAGSVAETLERAPSIYATTGARNERLFSIRGFDQRQTAVLIDGAPAFVAYDGQVDLGMLPPELVESISVNRGPGVTAVGPNGLGPTISVTTRKPGVGPFLQGRLEGAEPGAWRAGAIHSHRLAGVAYTVYAGGGQSAGFPLAAGFTGTSLQGPGMRLNSDRQGWYAGGSALAEPAPRQEIAVAASYVDGDKGVPPSTVDDAPRFWRFTVWRGLTAAVGHAFRGAVETRALAYLRLYDNLLDAFDDATYSTQDSARAAHGWYRDQSAGLAVQLRAPLRGPAWLARPGQVRAFATVAYDRHDDDPSLPAFQRVFLTAAPQLSVDLTPRLVTTVGGQLDAELPADLRDESSSAAVGFGPLLASRHRITDRLSIGATVSKRHRFPSLKERFSRALGTRSPNPALRAERAWHFDLEASWRPHRRFTLDASVFDAEVGDLIERVYLGSGTDQLQNVGAARLAGGEATARVQLRPWLGAELGYAYLWARRQGQSPGWLAYRPAHKAGLGLTSSPWPWLEVATFARVVGAQRFEHPTTRAWGTLGGYAVWDAEVEAGPFRNLIVFAHATNLLDTYYQTELGFPDPGRQLWVGLRAGLDRPPALLARTP